MDNIYSSQHKPVEGVPQQTLSVETIPDEEMTGADEELKRVKNNEANTQTLLAVVEKYIGKVIKREIILLIRQEAEREAVK
jgi:hypothetical protein